MDLINASPYIYTPLPAADSFRLIKLLPGIPNSPLQCRIIVTRRSTIEGKYEALSYAWGEAIYTQRLHETSTRSVISITDNLYHALHALRKRYGSRVLWVDAVCIAQSDVQEKNHQVRQMSQIYGEAQCVVVWLGQHDEQDAFGQLTGLGRSASQALVHDEEDGTARHIAYKNDTHGILPRYCSLKAVDALFGRPWFERVWVVQEYVLAKQLEFYLGRAHMSGQTFRRAIRILFEQLLDKIPRWRKKHPNIYETSHLMIFRVSHNHHKRNMDRTNLSMSTEIDMARCLRLFEKRQCSDERDRFYALLGLLLDDTGIHPDYNLDIFQVRMAVTKKTLLAGDLSVLDYAEPFTTMANSASRPSFLVQVPSACLPTIENPAYLDLKESAPKLSRAVKFGAAHICDTGHGTIGLRGVCVDRVRQLLFITEGSDMKDVPAVSSDEQLLDDLRPSPGRHFTSASHRLEIYRYISGVRSSRFNLSCAEHNAFLRGFWRMLHVNRRAPEEDKPLPDNFESWLLSYNVSTKALRWHVFFITELGFFGICSKWTRTGDHVVFFGGRSKPYTLRPVEGDDGHRQWKLIGDCYIEDCMEGHYFEPEKYDTCGKAYDEDAERVPDERFPGRTTNLQEELFILC